MQLQRAAVRVLSCLVVVACHMLYLCVLCSTSTVRHLQTLCNDDAICHGALLARWIAHRVALLIDPITASLQVLEHKPMLAAPIAKRHVVSSPPRPRIRCAAAAPQPVPGDACLENLASKLPKAPRNDAPTMQRRTLINMAGVAAAATLCPCTLCTPAANAGEGAGPWEYGQLEGPKNWGGVCQIGASQSPIDVPLSQLFVRGPNPGEGMGPIDFDYPAAGRAAVLNTGHGTMQVNVPSGNYYTRISGRVYELLQFHFHTPSEHTFDGKHYPMEAHLVHKDVLTGVWSGVGNVCGVRGGAAVCCWCVWCGMCV